MKKALFTVGIILCGAGNVMCEDAASLQEIQANLALLGGQLDALDDDFAQGQMLADASEKDMNRLVLPFFNWFAGISTTNKKDPATAIQSDLDRYNDLFKNYSKVYGVDDELYNYYAFGQKLLTALLAVNVLKSDLARLGITSDTTVVAKKLSLSDFADAQACMEAFSLYEDFAKQVGLKGFKKPFSSSVSDIYAQEIAIAKKMISLKDQISTPVKPEPQKPKPDIPVKNAEELIMDGILNPLLKAFLGSDTGGVDPNAFTTKEAEPYQIAFVEYAKKKGTAGADYLTYKFGALLLPALAAKNILEADLLTLGAAEPDDLVATEVKPELITDGQDFVQSFNMLQAFLDNAPLSFKSPLPAHLLSQYKELLPFAVKIASLATAVIHPQQPLLPAPAPVVSADTFIMKNFSDTNLSSLSVQQVNTLLIAFSQTYDSSDVYFVEYELWAAYVPARYRQLDLLEKLENGKSAEVVAAACNAFRTNYLNGFRSAYLKHMPALKQPYATQLSSMSLEFSVTDGLARLELQKISNNTFSL